MVIGDIVLNTCAGDDNPHKCGLCIKYGCIITRHSKFETISLLYSDGHIAEFSGSDNWYRIIGRINIIRRLEDAAASISNTKENAAGRPNAGAKWRA